MSSVDPIQLLFGGMSKLGPGDDVSTQRALEQVPEDGVRIVIDAGCGAGRQTMVLARRLVATIHALDTYEPFLAGLADRAAEEGLVDRIQPTNLDIGELATTFSDVDLIWSEGSAYNIGFENALRSWRSALRPGGHLVVSELCWLTESPPERARAFFVEGYPDMRSADQATELVEECGYAVLDRFTLPRESWVEGYYDVLGPRAERLAEHEDATVRAFAKETLEEIAVFDESADSYGYVMFVLRKASPTTSQA